MGMWYGAGCFLWRCSFEWVQISLRFGLYVCCYYLASIIGNKYSCDTARTSCWGSVFVHPNGRTPSVDLLAADLVCVSRGEKKVSRSQIFRIEPRRQINGGWRTKVIIQTQHPTFKHTSTSPSTLWPPPLTHRRRCLKTSRVNSKWRQRNTPTMCVNFNLMRTCATFKM